MLDYSLYLVTDRTLARGRSTVDIVAAAMQGGVSCVQIREKSCSTREFISEARAVKQLLSNTNIALLINDRVDVALAVGADGVHLGQTDMRVEDARNLVGESMVIGISAESVADACEAERDGADYIGISPVFATATKPDTAAPLGLEGVRAIRRSVELPLVAIGGIGPDNAAAVIQAGATGIAVVSAIVCAPSPKTAATELRQIITEASSLTESHE